jgi:hypothetical protein
MQQKILGLFVGKWEAKTDVRGLGGQIGFNDPSQYPRMYQRNY